jgi:PAS domain S-box-containing protein
MDTPHQAPGIIVRLPLILIIVTTLIALSASFASLLSGWLTIFQNLFYIPIILACYYYAKRGFSFSVLLSCTYFLLMLFASQDPVVLAGALIRVAIFIVVAGVITYLSTGRIQSEEALRESESRYRNLFESSRDAIMILEPPAWQFTSGNRSALQMFMAKDEEEFTSRKPWTYSPERQPDGRESGGKAREMIETAMHNGTHLFEWTHRRNNGEIFPATVLLSRVELAEKVFLQATVRDITDRKRTEEALRESEKKYRDFFTTSRDPVFITSPDGRWIDFNDSALEMFGYSSREELMSLPVAALYENPEERRALMQRIQTNDYVREYPVRLTRKDGRVIDTLVTSVPLRGEDGVVTSFIGSIRDITDLRRAQDELQREKDLWRATFDSIPDAIAIIDEHHRFIQVNQAMADALGISRESARGLACYTVVHGTETPPPSCPHAQLLKDGKTHSSEIYLPLFGGYFLLTTSPLFTPGGIVSGSVHVLRDITARKSVEDALRESEARYRELFENMSSGVAVYRVIDDGNDFVFKDFNRTAETIEEIQREYLIGRRVTEVFPGVSESGLFSVFQRVWRTGTSEFLPELVYRDSRVRESWRESWVYRLPGGDIVAVYNDISGRKRAEGEILFKNTLLETQQETSIDGILVVDSAGRIISYNSHFVAMWGISQEIIDSRSDERAIGAVLDSLADPEGFMVQVRFLYDHPEEKSREEITLKDGRVFDRYSAPMFGPGRAYYGRVWYFRDVTPRKKMEAALQQVNKKLHLMSSITRHDILNQLTILRGYLDLSGNCLHDPARLQEYIDREERAAATIESQIRFTRDYQDLGLQAPSWQSVLLNIEKAIAIIPMGTIRVEMMGSDVEIFADPLCEKVFFNLIDNAVRHGGDRMTTIGFSSRESEQGMALIVEDNGCGISPEDRKRLFERGFGKNTGLGLFLSREILSITGITITETSMPGGGARFEIVVPRGAYRVLPGK